MCLHQEEAALAVEEDGETLAGATPDHVMHGVEDQEAIVLVVEDMKEAEVAMIEIIATIAIAMEVQTDTAVIVIVHLNLGLTVDGAKLLVSNQIA